jgi:hypothetical protein
MKLKWIHDALGSIDLMVDDLLAGWVIQDEDGSFYLMTHNFSRQAWTNKHHPERYNTLRQAMRALRTHAIVQRLGGEP